MYTIYYELRPFFVRPINALRESTYIFNFFDLVSFPFIPRSAHYYFEMFVRFVVCRNRPRQPVDLLKKYTTTISVKSKCPLAKFTSIVYLHALSLPLVHLVFTVKTVENSNISPPILYYGSLKNLTNDLLQP